MAQNGMQGPRQFRTRAFQLRPVRDCKPAQDRAAGRRQPDPHFAFVLDARSPRDCARDLEAVYQLDGAVMLDEKSCCNFANRGLHALGKALDGQQQLMLLRLDVMLLGDGFAEMQELPDLPPELGQIAVLVWRKVTVMVHIYIVTRYIVRASNERSAVTHGFVGIAQECALHV